MDIDSIGEPTSLFIGPAREAVRHFPESVNVAATLSMAGIGFDRTMVEIVADPRASTNTHWITVKGEFGWAQREMKNLPSPENPKTSYLAALSAIATIRSILSSIKVGT